MNRIKNAAGFNAGTKVVMQEDVYDKLRQLMLMFSLLISAAILKNPMWVEFMILLSAVLEEPIPRRVAI
jgi:hypothetical protein